MRNWDKITSNSKLYNEQTLIAHNSQFEFNQSSYFDSVDPEHNVKFRMTFELHSEVTLF